LCVWWFYKQTSTSGVISSEGLITSYDASDMMAWMLSCQKHFTVTSPALSTNMYSFHITGLDKSLRLWEAGTPRIVNNWHMKVVKVVSPKHWYGGTNQLSYQLF